MHHSGGQLRKFAALVAEEKVLSLTEKANDLASALDQALASAAANADKAARVADLEGFPTKKHPFSES